MEGPRGQLGPPTDRYSGPTWAKPSNHASLMSVYAPSLKWGLLQAGLGVCCSRTRDLSHCSQLSRRAAEWISIGTFVFPPSHQSKTFYSQRAFASFAQWTVFVYRRDSLHRDRLLDLRAWAAHAAAGNIASRTHDISYLALMAG